MKRPDLTADDIEALRDRASTVFEQARALSDLDFVVQQRDLTAELVATAPATPTTRHGQDSMAAFATGIGALAADVSLNELSAVVAAAGHVQHRRFGNRGFNGMTVRFIQLCDHSLSPVELLHGCIEQGL